MSGIQNNSIREQLLRDPELTLHKATGMARSAELTQAQIKQIKADQKVINDTDESIHSMKSTTTTGGNTLKSQNVHYQISNNTLQVMWTTTSKRQKPVSCIWC